MSVTISIEPLQHHVGEAYCHPAVTCIVERWNNIPVDIHATSQPHLNYPGRGIERRPSHRVHILMRCIAQLLAEELGAEFIETKETECIPTPSGRSS